MRDNLFECEQGVGGLSDEDKGLCPSLRVPVPGLQLPGGLLQGVGDGSQGPGQQISLTLLSLGPPSGDTDCGWTHTGPGSCSLS